MYDELKTYNIPVYLLRDKDVTISPKKRVELALEAFGNTKDVIIVSNHINAGGGLGSEVIYALRDNNTFANDILGELKECGQVIRKSYQKVSTTNPNKDYYFMLRDTANTEAVIVEYAFLDNEKDASNLKNKYKEFAHATVNAILKYKNINVGLVYIVKKGDTLYGIAKKYSTSVNKIKSYNNLVNDILSINQKLVIPVNYYIVKKGDTLYSIAKKYNTTVDKLKVLNNLNNNILSIGQKIIIS